MKTTITEPKHTHLLPHILILVWVLLGLTATAQSWTNRYNGPGNNSDRASVIDLDRALLNNELRTFVAVPVEP